MELASKNSKKCYDVHTPFERFAQFTEMSQFTNASSSSVPFSLKKFKTPRNIYQNEKVEAKNTPACSSVSISNQSFETEQESSKVSILFEKNNFALSSINSSCKLQPGNDFFQFGLFYPKLEKPAFESPLNTTNKNISQKCDKRKNTFDSNGQINLEGWTQHFSKSDIGTLTLNQKALFNSKLTSFSPDVEVEIDETKNCIMPKLRKMEMIERWEKMDLLTINSNEKDDCDDHYQHEEESSMNKPESHDISMKMTTRRRKIVMSQIMEAIRFKKLFGEWVEKDWAVNEEEIRMWKKAEQDMIKEEEEEEEEEVEEENEENKVTNSRDSDITSDKAEKIENTFTMNLQQTAAFDADDHLRHLEENSKEYSAKDFISTSNEDNLAANKPVSQLTRALQNDYGRSLDASRLLDFGGSSVFTQRQNIIHRKKHFNPKFLQNCSISKDDFDDFHQFSSSFCSDFLSSPYFLMENCESSNPTFVLSFNQSLPQLQKRKAHSNCSQSEVIQSNSVNEQASGSEETGERSFLEDSLNGVCLVDEEERECVNADAKNGCSFLNLLTMLSLSNEIADAQNLFLSTSLVTFTRPVIIPLDLPTKWKRSSNDPYESIKAKGILDREIRISKAQEFRSSLLRRLLSKTPPQRKFLWTFDELLPNFKRIYKDWYYSQFPNHKNKSKKQKSLKKKEC